MPSPHRTTLPARWYLGAVGVFLIVLGLVFAGLTWRAGDRSMITRRWMPVPCTILVSEIQAKQYSPNDPTKWLPLLEYRYNWEGNVYIGSNIRRIEGATPHRSKVLASLKKYPPGLATTCYVNPENPKEAVLEHSSKAAFYTLWWPLLFSAGGTGMLIGALRRKSPENTPKALADRETS